MTNMKFARSGLSLQRKGSTKKKAVIPQFLQDLLTSFGTGLYMATKDGIDILRKMKCKAS